MIFNYDEIIVSSAEEFIYRFKLEDEFQENYNKTIEQWLDDLDISDNNIIETFLEKQPGKYLLKYNEQNTGYFHIFKIKE